MWEKSFQMEIFLLSHAYAKIPSDSMLWWQRHFNWQIRVQVQALPLAAKWPLKICVKALMSTPAVQAWEYLFANRSQWYGNMERVWKIVGSRAVLFCWGIASTFCELLPPHWSPGGSIHFLSFHYPISISGSADAIKRHENICKLTIMSYFREFYYHILLQDAFLESISTCVVYNSHLQDWKLPTRSNSLISFYTEGLWTRRTYGIF